MIAPSGSVGYHEINHMTIDERLVELTERHDALAQRVELLGQVQKEAEIRLGQLMDAIHRLTNIISSHEQRLDDLEPRR